MMDYYYTLLFHLLSHSGFSFQLFGKKTFMTHAMTFILKLTIAFYSVFSTFSTNRFRIRVSLNKLSFIILISSAMKNGNLVIKS